MLHEREGLLYTNALGIDLLLAPGIVLPRPAPLNVWRAPCPGHVIVGDFAGGAIVIAITLISLLPGACGHENSLLWGVNVIDHMSMQSCDTGMIKQLLTPVKPVPTAPVHAAVLSLWQDSRGSLAYCPGARGGAEVWACG